MSEIRSWYLDHNGTEYWLRAEDGERLRELSRMNPNGFSGTFDFQPLNSMYPVVIKFAREDAFTLTASGDD
ncbi:MAG: hypothetical protein AAGC66_04575 [Leifsonia sp.]